jgi:hypothetical protein
MTYRTRRRLALFLLLVAMPAYIVAVVSLLNWIDASFGRMPFLVEMTVYIVLGVLWVVPFRAVFRGVGQADPEAAKTEKTPEERG